MHHIRLYVVGLCTELLLERSQAPLHQHGASHAGDGCGAVPSASYTASDACMKSKMYVYVRSNTEQYLYVIKSTLQFSISALKLAQVRGIKTTGIASRKNRNLRGLVLCRYVGDHVGCGLSAIVRTSLSTATYGTQYLHIIVLVLCL
jgi:hypothetical protein